MVTYAPRNEVNPWAADTYNVAEQGAFVRRMVAGYGRNYGLDRARSFITQAQDSPNPWAGDSWSVTAQGILLTVFGMSRAREFARAAGTTVGGPRPNQNKKPPFQVIIQKRIIIQQNPGGGASGGEGGLFWPLVVDGDE